MLGGYPTAEQNGIQCRFREAIRDKISLLDEGHIFREDELALSSEESEEFPALRGYDYFHLSDGNHVGIVETSYLRRAPRIDLLLRSYQDLNGVVLRETGDRTAWRIGLKKWEPIRGYRFYTSGKQDLFSLGRMKIQFLPAPSWMFDRDALSDEALSILDTYRDKEADKEIHDLIRTNQHSQVALRKAKEDIDRLAGAEDREDASGALQSNHACSGDVEFCLQGALEFLDLVMGQKDA